MDAIVLVNKHLILLRSLHTFSHLDNRILIEFIRFIFNDTAVFRRYRPTKIFFSIVGIDNGIFIIDLQRLTAFCNNRVNNRPYGVYVNSFYFFDLTVVFGFYII